MVPLRLQTAERTHTANRGAVEEETGEAGLVHRSIYLDPHVEVFEHHTSDQSSNAYPSVTPEPLN